MATLLRVPEVAAGATEAVLSEWLVEEKAAFTADQPIVVIETDKATVEVPAEADAVLLRRLVTGGTTVEVGAPIALLGDGSERDGDLDAVLAELGLAPAGTGTGTGTGDGQGTGEGTGTGDGDGGGPPADRPPLGSVHAAPEPETAPDAGTAPDAAADAARPQTTPDAPSAGPSSDAQPVSGGSGSGGRVFASPLARRILAQAGLPLDGIDGSGPGGRIVRRDAERAVAQAGARTAGTAPAAEAAAEPPAPAPRRPAAEGAGWTDVPHSRVRRAIAARLTESKRSIPHFYVKRTARLDALLDLRRQLNEVSPRKISVNDLVLRAVALAHVAVPEANAVWTDDAVRVFDSVDVAVAIASERGLVTPVLRGVERMAPSEVARRTREFVRLADEGKLAQRDLEGGTIAVTNLGMFGVEEFAAIINPPQAAILAVGAAAPAPVVADGRVEVATLVTLVLSVDHRVIDGALAARWMEALVGVLERPLRLVA